MAVLGAYGPVVFETSSKTVRNFDALGEQRAARYAAHDVLNLEQKLQFLGLSLARVPLEMHFNLWFCTPRDELDALQALLESHKAYQLLIGGKALGEFVLERLVNDWVQVSNKGVLLDARSNVELREYK